MHMHTDAEELLEEFVSTDYFSNEQRRHTIAGS